MTHRTLAAADLCFDFACRRASFVLVALALCFIAVFAAPAASATDAPAAATAQETTPQDSSDGTDEGSAEAPTHSFFAETTVTATGSETDAFEVATPVTVLGAEEIERRAPDNAADLLRDEPGVDVNGVGPNQERPVIRGQRGLRVLFLENGLRLNNARRQTDFGEITGLVDVDEVETLEVVRGPASVLYGSDAVGGVLNLLTKAPAFHDGRPLGGSVALRYGTAGEAARGHASLDGRSGKLSYRLGLSYRDADDYEAAAGDFGDIHLGEEARVIDTGVRDDSAALHLGWELLENHSLALRVNRYRADQTGFGFVDPALLAGEDDAVVRILYPEQAFDRYNLGYLGSNLGLAVADTIDVQGYFQSNERQLANLIDINIGPLFPGAPDSSVFADTLNTTNLDTTGLRAEVLKLAGEHHLLTYGVEASEDDSENTDFSTTTTTLRFPFPPFQVVDVSTDGVANAPNATNTSYGAFVQDEVGLGERFKVTGGARYQKVETEAEPTPGWDVSGLDFSDDQVVGAVAALYRATDYLHLTASFGTAFRAPSIVERLFNGPTPEGLGFQILNPDLTSENSDNVDLGLKYRRRDAFLDLTLFRNEIDDGIVQHFLSPLEVAALPAALQEAIRDSGASFVVQQRNVERLRYEGAELAFGWRMERGLAIGGNYTYLDGERIDSANPPTGDTFGDKLNLYLRFDPSRGRFWAEYRLRRNGEEKANLEPDEPVPPVGDRLPAFTVHTLAGGVRLFEHGSQRHSVGVVIDNLTDELYAEFSNATFFRPQPGRNVTVTYRLSL